MQILQARPHLLPKALQAVPMQLEHPTLSLPFITSIDYICHLLRVVDIDPTVRDAGRALNSCTLPTEGVESNVKSFVATVIRTCIPPGRVCCLIHICLCRMSCGIVAMQRFLLVMVQEYPSVISLAHCNTRVPWCSEWELFSSYVYRSALNGVLKKYNSRGSVSYFRSILWGHSHRHFLTCRQF